jgi:uncharacterized protein YndB with AHSA1/START domain
MHTVEFKRLLPGPIGLAWDYLTKPELLKTWFADVTLEPRAGGAITVRFGGAGCGDGANGVNGTIREFRPPHVIAFSWNQGRWQASGKDGNPCEVRFELQEKGEKVLLTLLHSGLPVGELTPHSAGWHAYLDNLDSIIAGRGAIDFMAIFHKLKPKYEDRLAGMQRSGAA